MDEDKFRSNFLNEHFADHNKNLCEEIALPIRGR